MSEYKMMFKFMVLPILIVGGLVMGLYFFSVQSYHLKANDYELPTTLSQENLEIIDEIKNEYGIQIHIQESPEESENFFIQALTNAGTYTKYNMNIDNEKIYSFLTVLQDELTNYSDYFLNQLPKDFYLTGDFWDIDKTTEMIVSNNAGLTVSIGFKFSDTIKHYDTLYIIFNINCGNDYRKVIQHEFAHCFQNSLTGEKLQEFRDMNISCSAFPAYSSTGTGVSYACSSESEFISEAYAFGYIDKDFFE